MKSIKDDKFGVCSCDKLKNTDIRVQSHVGFNQEKDNTLFYLDGNLQTFHVSGKNFGCVHFKRRNLWCVHWKEKENV